MRPDITLAEHTDETAREYYTEKAERAQRRARTANPFMAANAALADRDSDDEYGYHGKGSNDEASLRAKAALGVTAEYLASTSGLGLRPQTLVVYAETWPPSGSEEESGDGSDEASAQRLAVVPRGLLRPEREWEVNSTEDLLIFFKWYDPTVSREESPFQYIGHDFFLATSTVRDVSRGAALCDVIAALNLTRSPLQLLERALAARNLPSSAVEECAIVELIKPDNVEKVSGTELLSLCRTSTV